MKNKKFVIGAYLLIGCLNCLSYAGSESYDEFTYVDQEKPNEVATYKVQCHNLKKNICNLSKVTVITNNKGECGVYSSSELHEANATRGSDGSWQVRRTSNHCNIVSTYTFTGSGMVLVKTTPSKYSREDIENLCKSHPPKTVKAQIVPGHAVKGISIGSCKELSVQVFMGDFAE